MGLSEDRGTVKPKKKARSNDRRFQIGVMAAIVCLVGVLLVTGRVRTILSEDSIRIKSTYWPSKEIPLEEIRSVEFREEFETGRRVGGFGSLTLSIGSFRNEEFGNYTLYGNNRCKSYVVIETEDGMVVVNGKNKERTLELYEEIEGRVGNDCNQ